MKASVGCVCVYSFFQLCTVLGRSGCLREGYNTGQKRVEKYIGIEERLEGVY